MKIDRLVGILAILMQKDTVTAPELARHFEVSERTIRRDVEALGRAGIPVATRQGVNGGISVMQGYRLDRTLLSGGEMQQILAGLKALDSVSGSRRYAQLMEKLCAGSSDWIGGKAYIWIDLASFYRDTLAPRIERIRTAIEERRRLTFAYYAPGGESLRTVEPYLLLFRWAGWYVWGWCGTRKEFRLFKLTRMEDVECSEETFIPRDVPLPDTSNEKIFPGGIHVEALFEPDVKWRLVEEFGPRCFTEQADGRLLFSGEYTDEGNLITWIMTFGERAVLLKPETTRRKIADRAKRMLRLYEEE